MRMFCLAAAAVSPTGAEHAAVRRSARAATKPWWTASTAAAV
jgi:hypothetical protein